MAQVTITKVQETDLEMLDTALRSLSGGLGDIHRADISCLRQAAFGENPIIRSMIAHDMGQVLGAVLFSPIFSTSRGAAGLYVSDLWVADTARKAGLGRQLLVAAAGWAETLWQARFLKLEVYDSNPAARRFYGRLGFIPQSGQSTLILNESGLNALKGAP